MTEITLTCRLVQERLTAYLDGELPEDTAREIIQHCAACDSCNRVLDELKALRAAATAWDVGDSDISRRVMAGMEAERSPEATLLSGVVDELRLLREEMRAARTEIAGLRAEVSELRRAANAPTVTVSRYREVPDLMPYAPPSDTPIPLG
jgi:anti-sigma factor RsiW